MEILHRPGERTLLFRGPHTSPDLWILTVVLGLCLVAPAVIGLSFVHWALGAGIAALVGIPWLVYVFSPIRIIVTDDGWFQAYRPFLPWRDVGRADELVLEIRDYFASNERFFKRCLVESARWRLWEVRGMSPADVETIATFQAPLSTPVSPDHDGGYRRAA